MMYTKTPNNHRIELPVAVEQIIHVATASCRVAAARGMYRDARGVVV